MPHIRIRSLKDEDVSKLSREIPRELAHLLSTSVDNFTVEKITTQFYLDGAKTGADPMIEVLWFDRGQTTQDACAKKVTELVRQVSDSESIAVVFTALPKTAYYENGVHF